MGFVIELERFLKKHHHLLLLLFLMRILTSFVKGKGRLEGGEGGGKGVLRFLYWFDN